MKVLSFFKRNVVLTAALFSAIVTSFFVPPDAQYAEYFDFKTLACLFCVLAVVCALRNINFFFIMAHKIVKSFKTARMSILGLVWITFIGSMLIANDMALLTFLPLGYFMLEDTGKQKYAAFTFVMQNIAANLGGMLTPFGNPQNLYLYSYFNIETGEFLSIMFPLFAFAVLLITICCLFIPNEPLQLRGQIKSFEPKRTILYLALFALSIVIVFKGIPYWIGLVLIPAVLWFFDRKALKSVDYPLLLTFAAFFVFSGNMSRIGAVRDVLDYLMEKNTLLFSVASCQVISNVPSAVLLSHFTDNYPALLAGVNIGGTGTLIASLASLITFREFTRHYPEKTGYYIKMFTLFNIGFLVALTVFAVFII